MCIGAADFTKEGKDQCDGGSAIDIIVPIDHNLLVMDDGFGEALHRDVHVFHQERVV